MVKKFIIALFSIFVLYAITNAQVNFELDFSFQKINIHDELTNIQILDYNNDGTDELFTGYEGVTYYGDNYWRVVCYSLNGDTLFTYSQEKEENEFFGKFYIYTYENIFYLITASYLEPPNLLIRIIDFDTYCLIDSFMCYVNTDFPPTLNFIKPLSLENNLCIYVGLDVVFWYWAEEVESFIYKFLFCDNSLSFIESIEGCGADLRKYDSFDSLISLNNYSFWSVGAWPYGNKSYSIKLLSHDYVSSINQVYYTSGSFYEDELGIFYNNYPSNFRILTNNDNFYSDYGLIIHYWQYDSDYGLRNNFINFSSDFLDTLWISQESEITANGYSINSSTCINTNLGDYFLLYFSTRWGGYPPMLEIRNRITGNIELSQESSISPFTIKQTSDDELLFFVDTGNEYEVYTVNDIYLGVNDEYLNIANLYQLSNYPNPFNPDRMSITTISFSATDLHPSSAVPIKSGRRVDGLARINIYNIKGQLVKELVPDLIGDRSEGLGVAEAEWDGNDENGKPVPSGIYLYKLLLDGKSNQCKKITIMR